MKLRISRSQKSTGMMSKTVTFCIDARAELTSEETDDVKKYGLGKLVVYNGCNPPSAPATPRVAG